MVTQQADNADSIEQPSGETAGSEKWSAISDAVMERSHQQGSVALSSRRALNGTAYRIYKLLQWLIQAPLTVEQLNRKFVEDGGIGKPVSTDSIWLYVNTLKALGCIIRRPSPRNGFAYQMVSHPFGLSLEQSQLETLAQAKIVAQRHFAPQEMLALDGLLKKLVSHGALQDNEEVDEFVARLFAQSRSLDSQECKIRIEQLEKTLLEEGLLQVTYASSLKGETVFTFFPESLFYRQGVVYVRGERLDYPGPSSLRVDRLLSLLPVQDDAIRAQLMARQQVKSEILLKVFVKSPQAFQGFALDPNQGVYQESRLWVDGLNPYYEVRLLVRDFFYVKQTILALGLPFFIESPATFKQEMQDTLRAMLKFYDVDKLDEVERSEADGHG